MKRYCSVNVLDKPDRSKSCCARCLLSGETAAVWLTARAAPHATSRPQSGARGAPQLRLTAVAEGHLML